MEPPCCPLLLFSSAAAVVTRSYHFTVAAVDARITAPPTPPTEEAGVCPRRLGGSDCGTGQAVQAPPRQEEAPRPVLASWKPHDLTIRLAAADDAAAHSP